MKKLGLLVVITAIVMSFAVTAFASCGTCGKCNTCPKPCVTCGTPCNGLQSAYDWMASWCMPSCACNTCAKPCNTCAKPACGCSK